MGNFVYLINIGLKHRKSFKYTIHLLNITHFPARSKMYKGAGRVHFILDGKCKKSEMLCITWLKVVGGIPFITVAKSKMY